MTCIIIEDQPPAQRVLKKYIDDLGSLELIGTFSDAIQAMEFLKSNQVDLMFLDIHLPKISGIDFLKTLSHPPAVILTTAFPDYALESYDLDVVDYLLKPFSFQRFVKAVAKIPNRSFTEIKEAGVSGIPSEKREIFIKSGYDLIKITLADVLYIKSDADYTEVFLPNKKQLSSEPLRYWLEQLDAAKFHRVHKSYIIQTTKIEKISSNQIHLEDGTVIPMGRAYKEEFLEKFVK